MLNWLLRRFEHQHRPSVRRRATSRVRVTHDDKIIRVRLADDREEAIAWSDLGSVSVLTTDAGPYEVDLHWILIDRDGHRGPAVPMGAVGEHELLKAMQSRLHGFDNMAVVEAMSSTANASFVVWQHHGRREHGASG
jgi:hypothetical protein